MFQRLKATTRQFVKNINGATAIEYGLIVSLIFLVIVTAVQGTASNSNANYDRIQKAMDKALKSTKS